MTNPDLKLCAFAMKRAARLLREAAGDLRACCRPAEAPIAGEIASIAKQLDGRRRRLLPDNSRTRPHRPTK